MIPSVVTIDTSAHNKSANWITCSRARDRVNRFVNPPFASPGVIAVTFILFTSLGSRLMK